jgi:hypothetical protein
VDRDELMNPNYKYVLVVRAVEDYHFSFGRNVWMHAPQEIVP